MSILSRANATRPGYARAGLAVAFVILRATSLCAIEAPKPPDTRVAALGLPSAAGADWQQWDSFLTNAVKKLAQQVRPEQQEQIGDVFLDSRYQLAQLVGAGTSDPVPQ